MAGEYHSFNSKQTSKVSNMEKKIANCNQLIGRLQSQTESAESIVDSIESIVKDMGVSRYDMFVHCVNNDDEYNTTLTKDNIHTIRLSKEIEHAVPRTLEEFEQLLELCNFLFESAGNHSAIRLNYYMGVIDKVILFNTDLTLGESIDLISAYSSILTNQLENIKGEK